MLIAQAVVLVVSLAVVGYTLNERRHIAPDPNKPWSCNDTFCVQTFDPSFGSRAERAVCFSRRLILDDIADDLCFSSFAKCEESRDSELKDPDFDGVGGCRVVSADDEDRNAYRRHVYFALVAGAIAVLIVLTNVASLWRVRLRRKAGTVTRKP